MSDPKVLILGSGIAGLSCALKLAESASPVQITLIAKLEASEGSTRYAQGGIASVWSKDDSFDSHIRDTLVAGADLCNPEAVRICVEEGPARVRELIEWGVEFTKTRTHSDYDLHQEGGHAHRRILHAQDLTGFEIERALLQRVREHPKINLKESHVAIDLITSHKLGDVSEPNRCVGAYIYDKNTGTIQSHAAHFVVLATGGAGKAYLYTSNPDTATGDGIAMAYRAGARIANMEFMQFHPTCLYHPTDRTFLLTEALRGEGAILKRIDGTPFMENYHPLASLAPRDIVARAIDMEMKRTGDRHVILDCSAISPAHLQKDFPNITAHCLKLGLDITRQPIPVVPAAHYTCGGVYVNFSAESTLANLYAVGETSYTGLHGANRLASNSLLEAVVFSHRASATILARATHEDLKFMSLDTLRLPEWDSGKAATIEDQIDISATWYEIRWVLWNYVGIVRSDWRLRRALKRIQILREEVDSFYWAYRLTPDLIELRNLVTIAELIVESASSRKESRGLHYTVDYPNRDDRLFKRETIL